jgi:hypothetical protein
MDHEPQRATQAGEFRSDGIDEEGHIVRDDLHDGTTA